MSPFFYLPIKEEDEILNDCFFKIMVLVVKKFPPYLITEVKLNVLSNNDEFSGRPQRRLIALQIAHE